MTKRNKGEIRLGRLESKIMNVVWDQGKATVHDVVAALSGERRPAYSTILTMMRKLEGKGYLEHDVRDRTYVYQATISRQEARVGLVGELLDSLFEGSPALLLNSLVEQKHINEKELKEIQKLLEEREAQNE